MTIEFNISPEYNLIIIVHTGTIKDDEFLAFYKSLFKSDSFDPSMNLLVDLRETDSTPRTSDALHQFAEFARRILGDTATRQKVAVVAPNDISFGLARMCEVFSVDLPWDFVVFRSIDAALVWIGAPEDFINRIN